MVRELNEQRRLRRRNSYLNHRAIDRILKQMADLRKARNLTQEELAKSMGVTQSYISQIENGYTGMFDSLVDYAQSVNGHLKLEIVPSEKDEDDSSKSASMTLKSDVEHEPVPVSAPQWGTSELIYS